MNETRKAEIDLPSLKDLWYFSAETWSEQGRSLPFEYGMSTEQLEWARANFLLRRFLGETPEKTKEYSELAKSVLSRQYDYALTHVGTMILETAICNNASWDSHFNENLFYNARSAVALTECFGCLPAEVIEGYKLAHEETGSESGRVCLAKKIEGLEMIPFDKDQRIDTRATARLAIIRNLDRYSGVRKALGDNFKLCNYNRIKDIMQSVADLGVKGALQEEEIKGYLERVRSMTFG